MADKGLSGSIYIAGHNGLVGSAIERRLRADGQTDIVTRSSTELELTDARAVDGFFAEQSIDLVFLAAARVGGILANDRQPVDFLRDNLLIQTHIMDAAYRHGARKLLFLGSSCIYPKHAEQPIAEESLLTGALEPTNQWYAIAKIAGLKLCQAYRRQHDFDAISVMPTNLYGPGDNFDLQTSHVLPALIRKCHEARQSGADHITIWGSGTPRREFLYVDDLADACVFLMQCYSDDIPINIGVGDDISILDLTRLVAEVVGFQGDIRRDTGKPDGTPRKLLDVSRLHRLGWQAKTSLRQGIAQTYTAFLDSRARA
ncbi:MAG: GDP-L-fucose synthase [Bacteroidetes bacterium]|jgi:GDP-L-fucose synthase|nr:GDP-L-fucose synthase [Bacteroidota bacterium]